MGVCEMLWVGVRRCGSGWDDVGAGGMLWGMWDIVGLWDIVGMSSTFWGV